MISRAAASIPETLEQQVQRLLVWWRAETALLSSSSRIVEHPAYQQLIALGPPALPFFFRDLEQTHDGHLSKALTAITGAHPVASEDRGQIRQIATTWLRWARANGYQW
jgi:hypothetical protein